MGKKLVTIVLLIFALLVSASLLVYIQYNKKVWESENISVRTSNDVISLADSSETVIKMSGTDLISMYKRIISIDNECAANGKTEPYAGLSVYYGSSLITADNITSYISTLKNYQLVINNTVTKMTITEL